MQHLEIGICNMTLLEQLLESKRYKKNHKCQTPGAVYSITLSDNKVTVDVKIPDDVSLPTEKSKAKELEVDLHYAVEDVLKQFF